MTATWDGLKRKALLSVGWMFTQLAGTNLLAFAVFVVLARLLTPEEFGTFALALLFIGLLRGFVFLALNEAIIQTAELTEEAADTVFWATSGLGFAAGLAVIAVAPLYGAIVQAPAVVTPLQYLAVTLPLAGLGITHSARALRGFGHKMIAVRNLLGNLLGGAAGIAAALRGYGLWSFVVQQLVIETVMLFMNLRAFPWRPHLRFSSAALAPLLTFAGPITVANLIGASHVQVEGAIVSRVLGVGDLGLLRVTRRIVDLLGQLTVQPFTGVSAVMLARLQDQTLEFRAGLLRFLALASLVVAPTLFGLGVVAPEAVVVVFGPQWIQTGPAVQILSLMGLPFTINAFVIPALLARGRSRFVAWYMAMNFVLTLCVMPLIAPLGLLAVIAFLVARAHLVMVWDLRIYQREFGIAPGDVLATVGPFFLAAGSMAVGLLVLGPAIRDAAQGSHFGYLLVTIPLGAALYGLALAVFAWRFMKDHLTAMRPLLRYLTARAE